MAAITRWTGGRFPRAFDFINAQRRRYILISQMAELLKDVDMYVPGGGYDVGLHAQTGHPCVGRAVQVRLAAGGARRWTGPRRGSGGGRVQRARPTADAGRDPRRRSSTTSSRSAR